VVVEEVSGNWVIGFTSGSIRLPVTEDSNAASVSLVFDLLSTFFPIKTNKTKQNEDFLHHGYYQHLICHHPPPAGLSFGLRSGGVWVFHFKGKADPMISGG